MPECYSLKTYDEYFILRTVPLIPRDLWSAQEEREGEACGGEN